MKKLIGIVLLISFCGGEEIPQNVDNSSNIEVQKNSEKESENLNEDILGTKQKNYFQLVILLVGNLYF